MYVNSGKTLVHKPTSNLECGDLSPLLIKVVQ